MPGIEELLAIPLMTDMGVGAGIAGDLGLAGATDAALGAGAGVAGDLGLTAGAGVAGDAAAAAGAGASATGLAAGPGAYAFGDALPSASAMLGQAPGAALPDTGGALFGSSAGTLPDAGAATAATGSDALAPTTAGFAGDPSLVAGSPLNVGASGVTTPAATSAAITPASGAGVGAPAATSTGTGAGGLGTDFTAGGGLSAPAPTSVTSPFMQPDALNGLSSGTGAAGGGLGSATSGLGSSHGILGALGLGGSGGIAKLGMAALPMLLRNGSVQGMGQTQALANDMQSLGSQYAHGILPQGVKDAIQTATNGAVANIRAQYAHLGLGGSTMEAQAMQDAYQTAANQATAAAQKLISEGVNMMGISANTLSRMMEINMIQDQAQQAALTNYIGAIAGGTGGTGTSNSSSSSWWGT